MIFRRRGVGRELMAQAEARAVERGCHAAWLDTFSFQARSFYEKLGYGEFGTSIIRPCISGIL
jgi:ribosomal protein S18 acetylase RimI-like enzyme